MKVEEIAEAVAKLPPDQLARFRRWFTAFEAGRTDHAAELDTISVEVSPSPSPGWGSLLNLQFTRGSRFLRAPF